MTTKYSPEKNKVITLNGWDKGLVMFGFLSSETTVKVHTALRLVMALDNDFPYTQLTHVNLTFDGKALATSRNGQVSMGVRSEEWLILSEQKGYMPAIMMDGVMHQESGEIVKLLAEKYPDQSLSESERVEVLKWVGFNLEHCEKLLETEKHFGTSALSPNEKNYVHLGVGKQDLAWEKEHVRHADEFLKSLDDHFSSKENKAYFVGDKLTYADCALINWPYSFQHLAALRVKTRYPNLWAHHVELRATHPEGAQEHYRLMPILGTIIAGLLLKTRGVFDWGHHIENPMYWEGIETNTGETIEKCAENAPDTDS